MNLQPVRFGFKETKKKDAAGNIVKDAKGEDVRIPAPEALTLSIPQFSTAEDLMAIAQSGDEKQIKLALEGMNAIIIGQAKAQVDEARTEGKAMWPVFSTSKDANGKDVQTLESEADLSWLDVGKLDWGYIAALPPSVRGGGGIPEETWEAFSADYQAVIIHHGKNENQAKMAANIFLKKFAPVKGNKPLLQALQHNLELWFGNTSQGEQLQEVYKSLATKLNTLLQADEDAIVASV